MSALKRLFTKGCSWGVLIVGTIIPLAADEVVTPLFCEHQRIGSEPDDFIRFTPKQLPLRVDLGLAGHVTALTALGLADSDDQAALLKAPGRPIEIVMRKGESLTEYGLDDQTVQFVSQIEAGPDGEVFVDVARDNLYHALLKGRPSGLKLVGNDQQTYGNTDIFFSTGHGFHISPSGNLAIFGCVRSTSPNCLDHRWWNEVKQGAALQITDKTIKSRKINSVWDDAFLVNKQDEILVEVNLEDGSDAEVLIRGNEIIPVAVAGEPVPGGARGVQFSGLTFGKSLAMNQWVAVNSEAEGGSLEDDETTEVIIAGKASSPTMVAQTGGNLPGQDPDDFLFVVSRPDIRDDGLVVFRSVSFNALSGSIFAELRLWRSGTHTVLGKDSDLVGGRELDSSNTFIGDPYFSPDGQVVYYSVSPTERDTGREIWMIDVNNGESTLVASPGREITLPDNRNGVLVSVATKDFNEFEPLQFDQDGRFLADLVVNVNDANLDCVALIDPAALREPDPVTIRLHQAGSMTNESVLAGQTDPNAYLTPRPDITTLIARPEVARGLVADGVTPLQITLEETGEIDSRFTKFGVKALVKSGGQIRLGNTPSTDLTNKLHWLEQFPKVQWLTLAQAANNERPLVEPQNNNRDYLYLEPIRSDDLILDPGSTELELELTLYPTNAPNEILGRRSIYLRKPPITLVHGYNTNGGWGEAFKNVLGQSRAFNKTDPADNFVRTVTYGQTKPVAFIGGVSASIRQFIAQTIWLVTDSTKIDEGFINHENTVLPLPNLVPMLHQALITDTNQLRGNWAFTRHDIVAHSQGGLLTRMLSSERGKDGSHPPYQNADNYFRGRFHRAITIGSPHNGSRVLGYLLMVDRNEEWIKYVPKKIAGLAVFSGLAQAKFDPFGPQIIDLNTNPQWKPDPEAPFHLIRTTINGGAAPTLLGDHTPVAVGLGLNSPAGIDVIPRGSDGIVDFDSMGGLGEGQPVPPNVFTLPSNILVSHSGPDFLFTSLNGPPSMGQVASPDVANHVIGALNQSNGAVFGKFIVPQLLDAKVKARMQSAATSQSAIVDLLVAIAAAAAIDKAAAPARIKLEAIRKDLENAGRDIYEYALAFKEAIDPTDHVYWFIDQFGKAEPGQEIFVHMMLEGPCAVEVSVPEDYQGDVLLKAFFVNDEGLLLPTPPELVTSNDPPTPVRSIAVLPGEGKTRVGERYTPLLFAEYESGDVLHRYPNPDRISVMSSDPSVVDVSDPTGWQMDSPGQATITVTYGGKSTNSVLTVTGTPKPPVIVGDPDSDDDGIHDLLEEAFGMNPSQRDPSQLPIIVRTTENGALRTLLDLNVADDGMITDDSTYTTASFRYSIEVTDDLQTWQEAGNRVSIRPAIPFGQGRATLRVILNPSGKPSFLRVRVDRP